MNSMNNHLNSTNPCAKNNILSLNHQKKGWKKLGQAKIQYINY